MLTVSTFNIHNSRKNNYKEKAFEIFNYLKNEKIDILNLQELFLSCEKEIKKLLSNHFSLYGKYRYFVRSLPFSESVPIITNKKILEKKTFRLPHFPSLLNRVITRTLIEDDGQKIVILNTHLDYKYDEAKIKQLNKIIKIIKKEKYPIILTGDFNLKTNNPIFKDFINELKDLGIEHIKFTGKTFKPSLYNRPIDHVFCSKGFKVLDKKIITNLDISDHYPVLVKLEYSN